MAEDMLKQSDENRIDDDSGEVLSLSLPHSLPHAVLPLAKTKRQMIDLQANDVKYLFRLKVTETARATWTTLLPSWSHILCRYRPPMMTQMTLTTLRTDAFDGSAQLICTRSDRRAAQRGADLQNVRQSVQCLLAERRRVLQIIDTASAATGVRESAQVSLELFEKALTQLLHPYGHRSYMKNVVGALIRRRSKRSDARLIELLDHFCDTQAAKSATSDKCFGLGESLFDAAKEKPLRVDELRQGQTYPERLLASRLIDGAHSVADVLNLCKKLFVSVDCGVQVLATCLVTRLLATERFVGLLASLRGIDVKDVPVDKIDDTGQLV